MTETVLKDCLRKTKATSQPLEQIQFSIDDNAVRTGNIPKQFVYEMPYLKGEFPIYHVGIGIYVLRAFNSLVEHIDISPSFGLANIELAKNTLGDFDLRSGDSPVRFRQFSSHDK